jgi:flagellar hook protein FlgE
MSLSNAMSASVSGLNTASTAISVIGDNIANISTPGFKERRAEFSDVLGQAISTSGGFAQTGSGTRVANVSQIFSQGAFQSTGRETDLAVEGSGFFVLEDQGGRSYSRAGMFLFDNQGTLVDPASRRVQGFGIDPVTLAPTGQLGDIQINTSVAAPQASTQIDLSMNLDAAAPLVGPFDSATPFATSNFSAPLTLFDSLGAGHPSTIYFTRTGINAWDWNATLPVADTTLAPANPGDADVVQGSGTLSFDLNGNLTAVAGSPTTFEFSGGSAPGQAIAIDFGAIGPLATGGTTQFSGESAMNSASQDGFGPGSLLALAISPDGFITASFSNGVTRPLSQIALANFPAVESLNSVGNNAFVETRESGQPLIGGPQSGQFGSVKSSSLEQSNVDLASQFIRLILNQRAFQANTRTVSTTNELLANLVQLGQ